MGFEFDRVATFLHNWNVIFVGGKMIKFTVQGGKNE